MAKKKKAKKLTEKQAAKLGWVDGYDVRWMKDNPDHPEYENVKKKAKKYKIWN